MRPLGLCRPSTLGWRQRAERGSAGKATWRHGQRSRSLRPPVRAELPMFVQPPSARLHLSEAELRCLYQLDAVVSLTGFNSRFW
jgi:hypothetical protein